MSAATCAPTRPRDGSLLWEVDTAQDYITVNGVKAKGGAMEGPGPTVVDGMLYVNSGYGSWGGILGNVLLAFSVNGKGLLTLSFLSA